ncbi:hypothetical protein IWZ01DRAFT_317669 [Phyllosticta capitalensis]
MLHTPRYETFLSNNTTNEIQFNQLGPPNPSACETGKLHSTRGTHARSRRSLCRVVVRLIPLSFPSSRYHKSSTIFFFFCLFSFSFFQEFSVLCYPLRKQLSPIPNTPEPVAVLNQHIQHKETVGKEENRVTCSREKEERRKKTIPPSNHHLALQCRVTSPLRSFIFCFGATSA